MADDNTSVGKISLDMELTSDLSKQIEQAASKIGEQLKTALQGLGDLSFNGLGDNIGKQMTSSIEDSMKAMQNLIEQNLSKALEAAMANMKAIKIPVEFDMPTNMSMPSQTTGTRIPQPRGPPMPKVNTGVNMEALKAQIDNLAQSLDITNAKIELQQQKLAGLKESYNQTFDESRKNQLQEQILKTEEAINKLTATSNKTGFALADLDDQFARLSNASKNSGSGITSFMDKLKGIADVAGKVGGSIKNAASSIGDFGQKTNSAHNSSNMFLDSMIRWGIVFPMIMNGLTAVGTYISSAFMTNQQFADSLNQIKSNLETAFMPIYQAILPALNSLMSALATATAYIASFISQLFGSTYQQSFGAAQAMQSQIGAMDIAQKQAKKTADSLGTVGSSATNSANAITKASKQAKGALAGFDEINQLQLTTIKAPKAPKTPSPAGSGVIAPITPMANMAPIEVATQGWADKFKNLMANLWKPFQEAWATEGQNTIDAAKHALGGILDLLGAIGKSFYIVWTNGTGERILVNLLKILQDVLNIIGDIGVTFANAWNKGNIGTQVVQSLANAFNNVLSLIDKMLKSVRTVWGEEGPKFADMFMQALLAGSGVIENITEKLGWIWDHGGQHAFEGLVRLGLKIGELALFIFTNFVAPFVNWFVNLISPAIAFVFNSIGTLFDALSGVINWLMGSGKPVLDIIIVALGGFILAWNGVTLAIKTFWGVVEIVETVGTVLGGAFDILLSPIGLVVLAIAAAIAIGVLLYQNWDTVKAKALEVWNNVLVPFGQFLSGVFVAAWNEVIKAATWLWNNVLVPLGNFILWFINTVVRPLASVLRDVLVIAFNFLKDAAEIVWKNVLVPLGEFIGGTLYKIIQSIAEIFTFWWNNVLKPLGEFLITVFKPVIQGLVDIFMWLWHNVFEPLISFMAGAFLNTFKSVTSSIGSIIRDIGTIFSGLIDFITGVFTGNWSKAWQGVVDIFGGIFNTLKDVAKAPLNGLISLVNSAIDALNQLQIKVPDGVPGIGGKQFGFSIGHIPMLAKGGIVDKPTTAMIGEAGKEAVVPLENNTGGLNLLAQMLAQRIGTIGNLSVPTLQQPQLTMVEKQEKKPVPVSDDSEFINNLTAAIVNALLTAMKFNNPNDANKDDRDVILQIDGNTIARVLEPLLYKEKQRIGDRVIIKTT